MLQVLNRTYKQNGEISNEEIELLRQYRDIFTKNGMQRLFTSLMNADYINDLPALAYYNLRFDDIANQIADNNDRQFIQDHPLDDVMLKAMPIHFQLYFTVPQYNLIHIGNICHFNVCINVLSSLTNLLNKMITICNTANVDSNFLNLTRYLCNAHSEVDVEPFLLMHLLADLQISQQYIDETNETMKKLLRCMYKNGITIQDVFYWDCSDEFYKATDMKLTLGDRINEVHPEYVLINLHDFNTINNINSRKIVYKEFNTLNNPQEKVPIHHVKLLSLVLYSGIHYRAAFFTPGCYDRNDRITIRDDLCNRYTNSNYTYVEVLQPDIQHVIGTFYVEPVVKKE